MTATITDQSFPLQMAGNFVNALAAHAQHAGHKLLRQPKLV